jgi:DNA polymerase elongation subunit (family B)
MTGMYSSILLRQNSKPKTDELEIFLQLLTRLSELQRDMSSEVKGETSYVQEPTFKVKALKRLIDSFHMYLGSARGLFSDSDQAEVVLTAGRAIQKDILSQIELFNATIIQSDDDGFFLLSPDNIVGEANQKNFIDRLSSTLPGGTTLDLTHRYKQMLSVRKNNYALLDQNDNVLIKGTTLLSRGMERFLRVFIQRVIECLLTTDFNRMHHAYATAYTQVMQHQWTPADFCRTDIVRMDTETYQKDLETGQITAVPAMEAAVRSSLFVKANSKVSYYFTGADAGISLNRSSRLADEWNPHQPDENTAYYLARLHEAVGKFRDFFEPGAFERIITLGEMFGFTDEGIRIVNRRITQEASEKKSEIEEYGIWLAEEE